MVVPPYGGCAWPVDESCLGLSWDGYEESLKERSIALASSTLQRLTGYRIGGCPVTVRPCKKDCADGFARYIPFGLYGSFNPHINQSGNWVNSCGCSTSCGCSELCEIKLPAPVGRIDEVKVDGVVLDPNTYQIDDGHLLVWTGTGECPWPLCQDLAKPDTEVGTFSVTYLNAYPVDSLGAYAAGTLAAEFAKACGGKQCRLPAGVTQIVRQGVTMTIAPGSFPGGFTGINEVDAFIALWNPNALMNSPTVWYPGMKSPRQTTL